MKSFVRDCVAGIPRRNGVRPEDVERAFYTAIDQTWGKRQFKRCILCFLTLALLAAGAVGFVWNENVPLAIAILVVGAALGIAGLAMCQRR